MHDCHCTRTYPSLESQDVLSSVERELGDDDDEEFTVADTKESLVEQVCFAVLT